jgi:hypothetical protein
MVIEPFVRMGPPPRSLAAEANDCFMVRTRRVQPNTRLRREISRATAGSPRVVCYPSHGINQITAATPAPGRPAANYPCDELLAFRNVTENRPCQEAANPRASTPSVMLNDKPDTEAANRQQPPSKVRYRQPPDRRARPQRWNDAVADLLALQAEYAAWYEGLPDNLRDNPTREALECGLNETAPR